MVVAAGLLAGLPVMTSGQTNPAPTAVDGAALEKEACLRNLKVILDALQAYRFDQFSGGFVELLAAQLRLGRNHQAVSKYMGRHSLNIIRQNKRPPFDRRPGL